MFTDQSANDFMKRNCPMAREGEPHELDGALLFLASDASQLHDRPDPHRRRRLGRPLAAPTRPPRQPGFERLATRDVRPPGPVDAFASSDAARSCEHGRMLQVRELAVEVGGNVILDGASFSIRARDKVGLVGRNGAGKTSLLKVLGGAADPYAGVVHRTRRPRLPARRTRGSTASTTPPPAVRHILSGRGFDEAMVRIEKLRLQMEEDPSERAVSRFTRAEEQFRLDGGYAAESEVRRIAAGLGLEDDRLDLPIGSLSGGQKRRVEIARILFAGSDVLLLDEPTNHLDSDAKEWLLGFMRAYQGRAARDQPRPRPARRGHHPRAPPRAPRRDRPRRRSRSTRAPTREYLAARAKDEVRLAKLAQRQAKEIDRLQTLVDRFGAKATKASMAHSIEKRIVRLEDSKVEAPAGRPLGARALPAAAAAGPARCSRARAWPSATATSRCSDDVDFAVERGERLLIMGLNGAGKTSLLRVLAGDRPADEGAVTLGHNVVAGYYAQEHEGIHARPHDPRAPARAGAAGRRDRPARHRRRHGPHRRQGAPGRRHPLRRREDEAGARHPRRRAPQPAAARRAHQQPRPRLARGGGRGAAGLARAASCW